MTFEPLSLTKGILIGYCLGAPLGVVFALMSPDADGYFYIDTMLAKVGGCGFLG